MIEPIAGEALPLLKLVPHDDPILMTPTKEFDFTNPEFDSIEFSKDLVKFMRDKDGLGLAANQVGVPYRIFAMRSDPNKVFFNPNIIHFSDEEIALEEGCLTYPGLYVTIKRSRHVRIRYTQPNGETLTEQFTGMSARIIQHEMDHINGVIFYNRANLYHRTKALREWRNPKPKK